MSCNNRNGKKIPRNDNEGVPNKFIAAKSIGWIVGKVSQTGNRLRTETER